METEIYESDPFTAKKQAFAFQCVESVVLASHLSQPHERVKITHSARAHLHIGFDELEAVAKSLVAQKSISDLSTQILVA